MRRRCRVIVKRGARQANTKRPYANTRQHRRTTRVRGTSCTIWEQCGAAVVQNGSACPSLPGEREWEKENGSGREIGRENEKEGDRTREGERERACHKAILRYYVRTSAQWLLALVGVVSLDVPVRCTNRTKGRTLWVPLWLLIYVATPRTGLTWATQHRPARSRQAGRQENVPRVYRARQPRTSKFDLSLIGFARSRAS